MGEYVCVGVGGWWAFVGMLCVVEKPTIGSNILSVS